MYIPEDWVTHGTLSLKGGSCKEKIQDYFGNRGGKRAISRKTSVVLFMCDIECCQSCRPAEGDAASSDALGTHNLHLHDLWRRKGISAALPPRNPAESQRTD